MGTEPVEYCRAIETYLCQKNDGHLIRVVGPSFELVSRWEADGVPLKVAFRGIDRYFERYYRKAPRRRPVRIDFCDADVRDVFDEWRRALGLAASQLGSGGLFAREQTENPPDPIKRGPSLAAHLQRAIVKLTSARATGALAASSRTVDDLIDRLSEELDRARQSSGGLRGEARVALIDRLSKLDAEMMNSACATLDDAARSALEREADEELSEFRVRLASDAYRRALEAAFDRLARERLGLPMLTYS